MDNQGIDLAAALRKAQTVRTSLGAEAIQYRWLSERDRRQRNGA
jgi:hypothetical protein